MAVCGCIWLYVAAYGCLWLYLAVYGCIGLYMAVYGSVPKSSDSDSLQIMRFALICNCIAIGLQALAALTRGPSRVYFRRCGIEIADRCR